MRVIVHVDQNHVFHWVLVIMRSTICDGSRRRHCSRDPTSLVLPCSVQRWFSSSWGCTVLSGQRPGNYVNLTSPDLFILKCIVFRANRLHCLKWHHLRSLETIDQIYPYFFERITCFRSEGWNTQYKNPWYNRTVEATTSPEPLVRAT